MKILQLTIKRKWFNLIASGVKKEEYREVKRYWEKRLISNYDELMENGEGVVWFMDYDLVKFRNGYHPDSPTLLIECKGIDVGPAVPEWSDNWQGNVFRIKLGDIIKQP